MAETVKSARALNPLDPYNFTHPAQYLDHLTTTATGLVHNVNHPTELLKSLIGSGWGHDQGEALAKLTGNLALGAATGGEGEALSGFRSVSLDSVENGMNRLAVHGPQGALDSAATDLAKPPPVERPPAFDPFENLRPRSTELDSVDVPETALAPEHAPEPEPPAAQEPAADEPPPMKPPRAKKQTPEELAKSKARLEEALKELPDKARVFDDETARKWAGKVWKNAADKIRGRQPVSAAFDYYASGQIGKTSVSSSSINTALRTGKGMSGNIDLACQRLDEGIAHQKVPQDIMVKRGVDLDFLDFDDPLKMENKVFTDKGYMSTALGDLRNDFAGKEGILHLKVPEGTRAMWMDRVGTFGDRERELLLDRGLQYHVHEVIQIGTQFHIFGEIL